MPTSVDDLMSATTRRRYSTSRANARRTRSRELRAQLVRRADSVSVTPADTGQLTCALQGFFTLRPQVPKHALAILSMVKGTQHMICLALGLGVLGFVALARRVVAHGGGGYGWHHHHHHGWHGSPRRRRPPARW